LGRTTRYEYDGAGNLIAVTRPDGEQSRAVYLEELGLPEAITDAGGATWRQTYDSRGLRMSLMDPLGAVTRFSYDERGHLTTITDGLGHTTRIRCNAAGLATEIADPSGVAACYERDAFGRTTAITDSVGATTQLTWTVEGNLATRTTADNATESWTYDGEGNQLTHTDQLGQTSTFEYTHFETLAARTTPDGARVTFTHDANMQLVAVTDALGREWRYQYDQAGRLVGERDFHGRSLNYELDAVGRLTAVVKPIGHRIRYAYDLLDRLTAKEADGRTTTYTYDAAGFLVRAVNPDADVIRAVDSLGNPLTESVNGRILAHTRDVMGRRTSRITPSGHTTDWTLDPAGRTTNLSTSGGSLDFAYDVAGREQRRIIADRLTLTNTWDDLYRLTGQQLTAPAALLQQRSYSYRADGNLATVEDLLTGPRTFDLDITGRVTAVTAATWTESYAYDAAGNLTDAVWPVVGAASAAVGARTYSGTELVGAGRVRYEQDAAGRTTLRQVTRLSRKPDSWHYTWDAEDRLIQVTTPDGTRWRYLYDPFGRRIAKQRLSADGAGVDEQTDFTWDGATLVEQTTQASYLPGPHTLTWDHRGLIPVAQTETIGTPDQDQVDRRFFAIVTDLVGTPTELVDPATDTIAWRTTPTLWGYTTWPSNSTTYTPLRFPGQYFDPETRLHYNVCRYYDPETARYTSPDPLGLSPSPNPDGYVPNPHTWTDRLGLSAHNGVPSMRGEPGRRPPIVEVDRAQPGWSQAERIALAESRLPAFALFGRSAKTRSRTYAAAIHSETGDIAWASSGGGYCAEGNALLALGGDPSKVIFTGALTVDDASRPFIALVKPVCTGCQEDYPDRSIFLPGVRGEPGGLWGDS
ncbi:hypothetical protein LN042_20245, partial [Kitasatospora sp. RB6PN24]|uniref:RHS repeat domain-containing protein n=1 Tax=Kitasatospora humi TaxID=2893891 RepID=UPI0024BF3B3C